MWYYQPYKSLQQKQTIERIQRLDIQQIEPIIHYSDTDSYMIDQISKMFELSKEDVYRGIAILENISENESLQYGQISNPGH